MYNWNTDTTTLRKNPEKYQIWRLEQLINFGLNGEKNKHRPVKKILGPILISIHKEKKVLEFWLR